MVLMPAIRWLLAVNLLLLTGNADATWQPRQLMEFTAEVCRSWDDDTGFTPAIASGPVEQSPIEVRGRQVGTKYRLPLENQALLELDIIERPGLQKQFSSTFYRAADNASIFISLSFDCKLQIARQINYDDLGQALNITSLDASFAVTGRPQWLNPPLEFIPRNIDESLTKASQAGRLALRVGMVDSGVNYRLPMINRRLARDINGALIGYDFWDQDNLPYDAHPLRSEFFVQRHGTRTASLLLSEAPGIELVPYRYPRPDMSRMQALVEHADKHQVAILGMPLGSNQKQDWTAFERAARAHPQMLFVVSAGNDGRDLDEVPVYPAALELDNMIVVTSADDYVRPAERTNWGRSSVDYLIPAENIPLIDYSGDEIYASGSSYAVSRMTALAAKLKIAQPQWTATDIVVELRRRYRNDSVHRWVSTGYVADPLAGRPIRLNPHPALNIRPAEPPPGLRLPLDILVLDQRWTPQRIEQVLQTAYDLLEQCGIGADELSIHTFDGDDYLRDLSTGGARTLLEATATTELRVVFARDTRMLEPFTGEAFGRDNTHRRPWLTNSVWLMLDVEDAGSALAHELYHVIANSGEHVEGSGNLMQSSTDAGSRWLTAKQCQRAQTHGLANRLLRNRPG